MHLICGEALFDVFEHASDARDLTLHARAGGSPYNVAIGLARLDRAVGFVGGLSGDRLGLRLREHLREEGVSLAYAVARPEHTTLSLVARAADGQPSYTFYGDGAADRSLSPEDMPVPGEDVALFHIGSYTCVVEPVAGTLLDWVCRHRQGRLVSMDPNVRPTVERDPARWRAVLSDWLPNLDLLKASEEDLQLLFPGEALDDSARRLLAAGPRLIVVTRGSGGAIAWTDHSRIAVPGRSVDVIDTVGAGDSFQAALLSRIGDRQDFETLLGSADALTATLRRAVQASSITCGRKGADPPRLAELDPPDQ